MIHYFSYMPTTTHHKKGKKGDRCKQTEKNAGGKFPKPNRTANECDVFHTPPKFYSYSSNIISQVIIEKVSSSFFFALLLPLFFRPRRVHNWTACFLLALATGFLVFNLILLILFHWLEFFFFFFLLLACTHVRVRAQIMGWCSIIIIFFSLFVLLFGWAEVLWVLTVWAILFPVLLLLPLLLSVWHGHKFII